MIVGSAKALDVCLGPDLKAIADCGHRLQNPIRLSELDFEYCSLIALEAEVSAYMHARFAAAAAPNMRTDGMAAA